MYKQLKLQTYFTTGEKETRAWTTKVFKLLHIFFISNVKPRLAPLLHKLRVLYTLTSNADLSRRKLSHTKTMLLVKVLQRPRKRDFGDSRERSTLSRKEISWFSNLMYENQNCKILLINKKILGIRYSYYRVLKFKEFGS